MTLKSSFEILNNEYSISIQDTDTNISSNVIVSKQEFQVLKIAVEHNHGILNLLSNKDLILSLYKKGLVNMSENDYLVVNKAILPLFKYNENKNVITMDSLLNIANNFKKKIAVYCSL